MQKKADKDAFTRCNSDPTWQRERREKRVRRPGAGEAQAAKCRMLWYTHKRVAIQVLHPFFKALLFSFAFFSSLTPCCTVETGPNKASPRQLRRLQQVSRVHCQTLSHIPRPQRAPTFSHNCSSVFDPHQQSFHVFTRKAAHWGGVSPGLEQMVVQVKTTIFLLHFTTLNTHLYFLFLKA